MAVSSVSGDHTMSPRISSRCLAMTDCCSMLQWFSKDSVTGYLHMTASKAKLRCINAATAVVTSPRPEQPLWSLCTKGNIEPELTGESPRVLPLPTCTQQRPFKDSIV